MYASKEQFRAFVTGGYAGVLSFQQYLSLALAGALPAVNRRACGHRPPP
jgi:hypothetical protein